MFESYFAQLRVASQTDRTGPWRSWCMQIAPPLMFQSHMHHSTVQLKTISILAECTVVVDQ